MTLERNSFSVCVSVQGIYKVGDGISVHKKYKKISIGFVRWHVRDRYRPHNKRLTYSGHNHLLFSPVASDGQAQTNKDIHGEQAISSDADSIVLVNLYVSTFSVSKFKSTA